MLRRPVMVNEPRQSGQLPCQGLIHGILFIFRPIRRRLMITAQPESRIFYLYRLPPSEKPSGSLRIRVEQLHHRPGQRHREGILPFALNGDHSGIQDILAPAHDVTPLRLLHVLHDIIQKNHRVMFHAAVKPFTSRFCEILFPGHDQMMNPGAGRAPFQARLNTLSCPLHPSYKGRKLVKVLRVIQQTTQEGQGCRAIPFLSLYPRPGRLGNRRLK